MLCNSLGSRMVLVSPGIQQKYLIVTCNYVAREMGVTKLMSLTQAKETCPQLVLVKGEDLTHYREISYKVTGGEKAPSSHRNSTKIVLGLSQSASQTENGEQENLYILQKVCLIILIYFIYYCNPYI